MVTKKQKLISIIAIIMAIVIIVITITFAVIFTEGSMLKEYKHHALDTSKFSPYRILTDEEVMRDAEELVKLAEATHARYYLYGDKQEYLVQKANMQKLRSMRAVDFAVQCAKYLASFYDFNTKVMPIVNDSSAMVDVYPNWFYDTNKDKIYLASPLGDIPSKSRLVSIGGVSYENILLSHNMLQGIENRATQAILLYNILYTEYLEVFGCEMVNDRVEMIYEDTNGNLFTEEYPLITRATYADKYIQGQKKPNYEVVRSGSDMTIIVRSFAYDSSYDSARAEILDAVLSSVDNITIDLRNNYGDGIEQSDGIMKTLGLTHSRRENNVRLSLQTRKYFGTSRFTGMARQKYKYLSINKNNLKVKVMTNEYTYGTALQLAAALKYSNLATIVGRPSGQSPNFCGDYFYAQLENSGIIFSMTVSYGRLYNKSGDEVGNVLEPDEFIDWQA